MDYPASSDDIPDPDPTTPPVDRYLELSTGHLPRNIHEQLSSYEGVVAYSMPIGWLLWCPEDPDGHATDYQDQSAPPDSNDAGVPSEVLAIQRLAAAHRCRYVLLDRDGQYLPALPRWDW